MPQVICLGEILIDQIAKEIGANYQEVKYWQSYPGGAPANVACALAKLGTTVGFIGCIGQDGMELANVLQTAGVDTTGLQIHPTAPTRQVYVTRSMEGDRNFVKFSGVKFSGDSDPVFADALLSASLIPVELFEDAEFLVLGTLGLAAESTAQAIAQAVEYANDHFVQIVVDVNWRPIFWADPEQAPPKILDLLSHADFLKLSAEEAQWLFKTSSPKAIAQELDHLEGVIVTNGDQECRYYLGERQGKLPAFKISAIDTTGAGDAFLAGFLHQLGQHTLDDLADPAIVHEIMTYACAVGAITTLGMGAIAPQPTDLQVQEFLALTKPS